MPTPAASTSGSANAIKSVIGMLPLVIVPPALFIVRNRMPDWVFMWALAFSIFAGLKWITWWRARNSIPHNPLRSLAYLFAWPGMDAESFLDPRAVPSKPQFGDWLWAFLKTAIGVALLWAVARWIPPQEGLLQGWVGLFGLIFLLHFGSFHLIALLWRSLGVQADPIMNSPIRSKSLSEFWGKRWNLGFRQLAHDLIFRPLHRRTGVATAGFLVFIASGVIHDFVISLPARGGYGLPTGYFALQGLSVMLERSHTGRWLGLQQGVRGWLFTILVTAGPAFWLFHPPFVLRVVIPFMRAIRAI
jgi:Membrane bound O-acyl transferase family